MSNLIEKKNYYSQKYRDDYRENDRLERNDIGKEQNGIAEVCSTSGGSTIRVL